MKNYKVYIEINGKMIFVGQLESSDGNNARFIYDADYLELDFAKAISISLPLQEAPFTVQQTRNFFEALLPEGFTRQTLASNLRKDENDYLGLLSVVGKECIGAILICEESYDNSSNYELISDEEIKALANEGATKSAKILSQTHLSLAGATGKVGLYLDEKTGKWFLPKGLALSTHIIKQSHVRYSDIVINEALCISLAKKCGIDVPDSFIIDTGGKNDANILFATKRFDRYLENGIVHRLHQEDFGQALSISPGNKYELEGLNYMRQMFKAVREFCINPIEDQIKLFKMIVFNVVIGNTDAHVKNYSLVYDKELGGRSLSPAYDLLCTSYHNTTRTMSFNINGKYDVTTITYNDLINAAGAVGVGHKIASKAIDDVCYNFENNLKETCKELIDQGFEKANAIADAMPRPCL